MARYIDADALMEKMYARLKDGAVLYRISPQAIYDAPTADVVPKSEVERLEVELKAMRGAANSYKMHYENAKSEVAREIILEIDTLICCHANGDIDDKRLYVLFDELKKKYIGGDTNVC